MLLSYWLWWLLLRASKWYLKRSIIKFNRNKITHSKIILVGNRCSQVQCLNGGTCEERQPGSISYAYCFCKAGYTGSRCETQYFSCTTNGRFTDAYGCDTSRYLECSNNVLYRRDCSPGLRYNPTAGRCDYAANVRC